MKLLSLLLLIFSFQCFSQTRKQINDPHFFKNLQSPSHNHYAMFQAMVRTPSQEQYSNVVKSFERHLHSESDKGIKLLSSGQTFRTMDDILKAYKKAYPKAYKNDIKKLDAFTLTYFKKAFENGIIYSNYFECE